MKDNLSYLLSTIEFSVNVDAGNKSFDNCEKEILKQQPKWQKYLEEQAKLLQEAVKIFKSYDTANKLASFWLQLKNKKATFSENIFEQLFQLALQAHERGVLRDAYAMFMFISTYYPKHYNTYLYLGSIVQEMHGPDKAAEFFKIITSIFAEPDLLFLAAENEIQREDVASARDYLQKSEAVLSERGELTEYETELKSRIEELLKMFDA